jgi:uncharacterized membrane protein
MKKLYIFVALVVIAALLIGVLVGAYLKPIQPAQASEAQYINGYFVDLNGDGILDYVVDAHIVIMGQPTPETPTR